VVHPGGGRRRQRRRDEQQGDGRLGLPPTSTGGIAVSLAGPQTNGWFTGDVGATISGAPGISYSLDGAPFVSASTLTVSGTGVHTLAFQGSDGSHGSTSIPIDATPPTISIAAGTLPFGGTPQVVCADAGSGIASCDTTPSPLDTTPGTHTLHVHAVDRVGNVADRDATYTIGDLVLSISITPSSARAGTLVLVHAAFANKADVSRRVTFSARFAYNTSFALTTPSITVRIPAHTSYAVTIPFIVPRRMPAGTYTVELDASDVNGPVSASASLTVS
jgi:hypothetical protein